MYFTCIVKVNASPFVYVDMNIWTSFMIWPVGRSSSVYCIVLIYTLGCELVADVVSTSHTFVSVFSSSSIPSSSSNNCASPYIVASPPFVYLFVWIRLLVRFFEYSLIRLSALQTLSPLFPQISYIGMMKLYIIKAF